MADDEDPRAGEATTTNYGWTKPNVMGSDDAWGGYLNADLDGIDNIVHGIDTRPPYSLPTASTTVLGGVKVDGTTITISGGTISGTPPGTPPVTIGDVPPPSPQVGALWFDSVGGQLYTWFNDGNSSQWTVVVNPGAGSSGTYLPLNGGALSGPVSGPSATFANLSAPQAMGDNRIINGDMRIDQRNNGASGTAASYTVDRWFYNLTQNGKITWGRNGAGNGLSGPSGFPYCLGAVSMSAYASLAGDVFEFYQPIEADFVSDLAWGTSSAQSVTLSFWAYSSLTGTFSGSIRNPAGTRSYPFTYSIPSATTWTKIVITVPGDTAGTWVMTGNAASILVAFNLGAGSTYRGPANAWASSSAIAATGAVSVVATNGASFYVTGVKLEVGSVATPFNRQSLAKSMADCQRYYQKIGNNGIDILVQGYAVGANQSISSTIGISAMIATPTATRVGAWTLTNISAVSLYPGRNSIGIAGLSVAAGSAGYYNTDSTGYITLSAEL